MASYITKIEESLPDGNSAQAPGQAKFYKGTNTSGDTYYRLDLAGTAKTANKGDIIYLLNDFKTPPVDTDGNAVEIGAEIIFGLLELFDGDSYTDKNIGAVSTGIFFDDSALTKFIENKGEIVKLILGEIIDTTHDLVKLESITRATSLPNTITINGKIVVAMSVGSETGFVKELDIDNKTYTFAKVIKNINVTEDEIKDHIFEHTTWATDPVVPVSDKLKMVTNHDTYEEGVKEPTSSSELKFWNMLKQETITDDNFESGFQYEVTEFFSPYIKHITGGEFERGYFEIIGLPFLEDTTTHIGESTTLKEVTVPVKWNTDAGKEQLLGTYISDSTVFNWVAADGTVPVLGTYGTIADAKLKGLNVTYSKSTLLVNNEKITATVKYDSALSDTLNGVANDSVFSNIDILYTDRTITEWDVKGYANSHTNWAGTSGNLNVAEWPNIQVKTKLYTPDLHMVDKKEVTLTVQADHKFTVDGGASVDFQYIPLANRPDLYFGLSRNIGKLDDTLSKLTLNTGESFSIRSDLGYYGILTDGTIIINNESSIIAVKDMVATKLLDLDRDKFSPPKLFIMSDDTIYITGEEYDLTAHKMTYSIYKLSADMKSYTKVIDTDSRADSIINVSDGTIYVSMDRKVYTFDGTSLTHVFPEYTSSFANIWELSDGTIYFGGDGNPIYKLDNGKLVHDATFDSIRPYWMYETSTGIIYLAGSRNGLWKLDSGTLTKLNDWWFGTYAIVEASDGVIWIAPHWQNEQTGIYRLVNDQLIKAIDDDTIRNVNFIYEVAK